MKNLAIFVGVEQAGGKVSLCSALSLSEDFTSEIYQAKKKASTSNILHSECKELENWMLLDSFLYPGWNLDVEIFVILIGRNTDDKI